MKYLSRVETWITKSTLSDDGWSEIKPFLLLKLTTNNGIEGWGEAFTLPFREKGVSEIIHSCLLYTSPSPRDGLLSRMPSSA